MTLYPRWEIAPIWPQAMSLFFVGSLFPVLGFLNVYPFVVSFVASHFQYVASLGVITAAPNNVIAHTNLGLALVPSSRKRCAPCPDTLRLHRICPCCGASAKRGQVLKSYFFAI